MIFKNDIKKQSKFVKKYIIKMSLIFGFSILINAILFIVVLPKIRQDLANIQNIMAIAFSCLVVYCSFMVYLFSKKVKKNYEEYACEISGNTISVYENGINKKYAIEDIKNIQEVSKDKYKITFKNNSALYTSELLEQFEEFKKIICSVQEPKQKTLSNQVFNILSCFFCIGFFLSRFIPNLYMWFFFAIGFVVTSIMSTYKILQMNIKIWIKIYHIVFYLFINGLIINALITVLKRMLA